jgi:glycerophosphoryl diester phosphodiesterase
MAGFRAARENGFDTIDIDVVGTADRALLIFHDPYLSRLTTGSGQVHELTAAQIAAQAPYRHECRAPGAAGQLDSFHDALDEFDGMRFNLEVKNDAALDPLIELLATLGDDRLSMFCLSGTEKHCAVLRKRFPAAAHTLTKAGLFRILKRKGWPPGVDCAQLPITIAPFDVNRKPWVRQTLGKLKVGRPFVPLIMDRAVQAAEGADAPVIYWTVNELVDARWAFDRGAVAVLSDRPVELRRELST